MSTASGPTGNNTNNNFGHKANQALNFENVQATAFAWINSFGSFAFGIAITVAAANTLVSATAKSPTAVFGRRAIASQKYASDIGALSSMLKSGEEFINGMGTKRVANFGAIESDADSAMLNRSVVGDIGEFESGDDSPSRWFEDVRNFAFAHGFILSDQKVKTPFCHSCFKTQ
jgi:hypothetical protein